MTEHYDQTFDCAESPQLELGDAEFEGCTFVRYKLPEARLSNSRFVECAFIDCDLSNAMVINCIFRSVTFADSKLIGINWTQAKSLNMLSFCGCILNYANFIALDLAGISMTTCIIHEALFTESNLSKATFTGTDFRGSEFLGANLSAADFRQAFNYQIRPSKSILKKTRFSLPEATTLLYGLDIILDDAQ